MRGIILAGGKGTRMGDAICDEIYKRDKRKTLSMSLLQKLYLEEEKSSNMIGEELGYSGSVIRDYLKKYDLSRTRSEANRVAYKQGRWKIPDNYGNEFARKYDFNQQFFKKWNSQMAYILGFIITDGHITKRDSCLILIQKDKDLLIQIRKTIGPGKISSQNGSWRLVYSSITMKEDLAKLGLKSKTFSLEALSKIPDELKTHFFRGVLDGDGYICYSRNGQKWISGFVAARKDFLEWIRNSIPVKGGGINHQSKAECYTLQFGKADTLILGKFLYNNLSKDDLYLKRKKKRFDEAFSRSEQ